MLREKLPQDKENAIKTNIWKFKFDLYYDKNADKMCINEASSNKIKPIKIYIDMDKIYTVVMNDYMASTYKYDHKDPGQGLFRPTAETTIDYLKELKNIPSYKGMQRVEIVK